jgi:hypothetical protein
MLASLYSDIMQFDDIQAPVPEHTGTIAFALDEKWTKNDPKIGPNGSGFLSKRKSAHMITIDALSANYLFSKAVADHKTPAEVISDMVQKEITSASFAHLE